MPLHLNAPLLWALWSLLDGLFETGVGRCVLNKRGGGQGPLFESSVLYAGPFVSSFHVCLGTGEGELSVPEDLSTIDYHNHHFAGSYYKGQYRNYRKPTKRLVSVVEGRSVGGFFQQYPAQEPLRAAAVCRPRPCGIRGLPASVLSRCGA